jgi:tetratricopeptide (TPR) repeat protein/tRNA A-37 threonylcarbamoyl transferase component Bud32
MVSPGDKIKHYEIIRLIGKGGMGEVYLAHDTILDRRVAIKFLAEELLGDPKLRERFLREAKSAAALDHPFICKIFEAGDYAGKAFIVMEYVEGQDLQQKLEKEHLPLRESLRIISEIAEALEEAHKKNIVHRDLKPANIMITPQGHTKVMDFGLAKHFQPLGGEIARTLTQASLTGQGMITGTINYMSPEQARGDPVDHRSDIFSLGIIFYEMIAGKHPFSKLTPVETLTSILRDPTPPPHITPKSVNPLVNPILKKALAKDLTQRYQNIGEFLTDLKIVKRETGGGGRFRLRGWPAAAAAVLLVAIMAFVVLKLIRPTAVKTNEAETKAVSLIIADVQNKTGESDFNGLLEQLLGFGLGAAENVSLYERKQAISLINHIVPNANGELSEKNARLLCKREGINVIVNGSIEKSKTGYLIKATAIDVFNDKKIADEEQPLKAKDDILKAADILSKKLKSALGVIPPNSADMFKNETFTTTSLEAMKPYIEAQMLDAQGKGKEAIEAYLRAIDIDPNLGRAYAGLAVSYYEQKEYQLAEKYYKLALERVEQMTDREKHRTRGGYYLFTQNYKRAIQEYTELLQQSPKDMAGHTNLAFAYFMGYKMQEAFQEGLRAVEIDPENLDYRYNQSWYALAAGDFERAKQEAKKTLQIRPSYEKAFVVLALVEMAQGRPGEAAKIYQKLEVVSPFGASLASAGSADLAIYEGRAADAIAILKQAISADVKNKMPTYVTADKFVMLAQAYLLQGKNALAIEAADQALKTYKGEDVFFAAAQVYIEAGQEDKARNIAGVLNKKVQDIHLAYGKLIGGYLSLKRDQTANARKLFDEAQGLVDTWLGRYAMGRAYLEAGAYPEAVAEFERCGKRKGEATSIFLNDFPTYRYLDSLDYFMGRAQEGQGSKEAAKKSYEKFLQIKAKADGGQAPVADAKERLGKL